MAKLGPWLQGRTAVIATHRKPILALTERLLVIKSGKLSVDGPRADVLAHLNKTTAKAGSLQITPPKGGK